MLYFELNYRGTRFLSTENKNYSMSWWILAVLKPVRNPVSFFCKRRVLDASEGKKFR